MHHHNDATQVSDRNVTDDHIRRTTRLTSETSDASTQAHHSPRSAHRPPRTSRGVRDISRRQLLAGTGIGVGFLALAACSGKSSTPSATSSASGAASSNNSSSHELTVITHDSFAVSQPLIDAFQKDSGYTLNVVKAGDAGKLVNKLILTKDAPLGDAVYGIDNTFATRALSQGIIDTSVTPTLPAGAEKYLINSTTAFAPIDIGDVCLNVDHAWFTNKKLTEPVTFDDLLKPEYKGLLVAINPATSSPGLAWLLATIGHYGPTGFADYWKKLVANGTKIVDSWETAYESDFSAGGGQGSYPIVVSYSSSPSYTVSDDKLTTSTGALLQTAFRQVEYAGVLKGAKNPTGAKAFIEWMLSTPVQEDIPTSMYVYPVVTDTKLPDELKKFGPLSPKPETVSPDEITKNREQWIQTWTEAVGV